MKTVNQIKQEMELVEIVKSALDINGQVAHNLIKKWTQTDVRNGVPEGATFTLSPNETVLRVSDVLIKNWSECIAKSENSVQVKKEININAIPLQLLTKVNGETSNKEIDSTLSTIRSIEGIGFYVTSKEGSELRRIESLLEERIIKSLDTEDYKTLEGSVRLLQRIKEGYRKIKLSSSIG